MISEVLISILFVLCACEMNDTTGLPLVSFSVLLCSAVIVKLYYVVVVVIVFR